MPKIFHTIGSLAPGMTTIHVLTGAHAPFGGPKGVRFVDITDGSTHTLLCVVAGAEHAAEWTKPGGLEFDPAKGVAQFGTPPDPQGFPVTFMDGAGRILVKNVDSVLLAHLVNPRDGNAITQMPTVPLETGTRSRVDDLREKVRKLDPTAPS